MYGGGAPALDMRHTRDEVPGHDVARAVRAEDGTRRVVGIAFGVVACTGDDVGLIGAGAERRHLTGKASEAVRVGRDFLAVVFEYGGGRGTCDNGSIVERLRGVGVAAHTPEVVQGAPRLRRRYFQAEVVPGFQQDALRGHEALSDGAVHRFAEVSALGMLLVCAPGQQCKADVRDRGTRQHADVFPFGEVGKDEALPVPRQRVFRTGRRVADATPRRERL